MSYVARLADGTVFDSRPPENPLEFTTEEGGSKREFVPKYCKYSIIHLLYISVFSARLDENPLEFTAKEGGLRITVCCRTWQSAFCDYQLDCFVIIMLSSVVCCSTHQLAPF